MNDSVIIPVKLEASDENVKQTLDKIRSYMSTLEKRKTELIDTKQLSVTKADLAYVEKELGRVDQAIERMKSHYAEINNYIQESSRGIQTYADRLKEEMDIEQTYIKPLEGLRNRLKEQNAEMANAQKLYNAELRKTTVEERRLSSTQGGFKTAVIRKTEAVNAAENAVAESLKYQTRLEKELVAAKEARIRTGSASISDEERLLKQRIETEKLNRKNLTATLNEAKEELRIATNKLKVINAQRDAVREAHRKEVERSSLGRNIEDIKQEIQETEQLIAVSEVYERTHAGSIEKIQQEAEEMGGLDKIARKYSKTVEDINNRLDKELATTKEIAGVRTNINGREINENNRVTKNLERMQERYSGIFGKIRQIYDKSRERVEDERRLTEELESQGKHLTGNATLWYRALRTTKMLNHELQRINGNLSKFAGYFTTVLKGMLKTIVAVSTGFLSLIKRTNGATRAHEGFAKSLKSRFTTLLKYTLGIRSLFVLANRLRSSMTEAMNALSLQAEKVNDSLSRMISSLQWIKGMLATVVQPFLNILVPALDKVSVSLEKVVYNVSSFFAALTGQDIVYIATKQQLDYAESLGQTAKNAKSARKELSGLDILNVLHSQNAEDTNFTFNAVPISEKMKELADKWKDILSDFFKPLKDAWNRNGQPIVDAIGTTVEKIKDNVKLIGSDLLEIWNDPNSGKILDNILRTIENIVSTVSLLSDKFTAAWNKDKNGEKILTNTSDIIGQISEKTEEMSEYFEEFAENLDVSPLLEAVNRTLEKLKGGPLQTILDLVGYFYHNVVFPFMEYMVEEGLPKLLDTITEIVDNIDWDNADTQLKRLMDSLEPFLEKSWETLVTVLGDLGKWVADFVNDGKLEKLINHFEKWVDNADPEELAKKIEKLVKSLIVLKITVVSFEKVTSILITVLTLISAFKNASMLFEGGTKTVTVAGETLTTASFWDKLVTLPARIGEWFTALPGKISSALSKIGGFFSEFVASLEEASGTVVGTIGGIVSIITGGITAFSGFTDQVQNGANIVNVAMTAIGVALTTVGAILLGAPAAVAAAIGAIVFAITELVVWVANIGAHVEEVKERFHAFADNFVKRAGEIGKNLGKLLGQALRKVVDFFKELPGKIKAWITETNWKKFGEDLINGILWIFTDGIPTLLKMIKDAVTNFVSNFVAGFKEGFDIHSPSKVMMDIGDMIMAGLLGGITDKAVEVLNSIGDFCSDIWKKFKNFFGIHSPSKLMAKGGKYLMEGLSEGVEDETGSTVKAVGKSMDKIVDEFDSSSALIEMFDREEVLDFKDFFIGTLQDMCQTAISLFDTMINSINYRLSSLSTSGSLPALVNALSKVSNIEIPKIAGGYTIPTKMQIRNSAEVPNSGVDLRRLSDIIKTAIRDVVTDVMDNHDQDVVINIDGHEILRAVVKQNEVYKKQHGGTSVFA